MNLLKKLSRGKTRQMHLITTIELFANISTNLCNRIHILLNNDYPLPKHLLSPNSSGRFVAVLSRKARVQLSDCLKHFCSFVLLDNTTFIKFIYETTEDEKGNATTQRLV